MIHGAFANPFDLGLFHLINGLAGHNHVIDAIVIFFAKDALEIYALLFLVAWFTLPKRDITGRNALVAAGLAGILALLINVVLSHIWFRPRPFAVLHQGTFTELVSHSKDASFPSDHTSGSFGFAAASWGTLPKIISVTFTVIAVVVMFARVYVGVHYPTDVLAGALVGTVSGRVMCSLSKYFLPITTAVARVFRFGPQAPGAR